MTGRRHEWRRGTQKCVRYARGESTYIREAVPLHTRQAERICVAFPGIYMLVFARARTANR